MVILFSPSETKVAGGSSHFSAHQQGLIGGGKVREELIALYEKKLTGSEKERVSLTGWKDLEKVAALPTELGSAPVLPALQRYTGVGYQYLDTGSLSSEDQEYLMSHVLIFSNLLGPLRGSDLIPETKLKQTKKLGKIDIAKQYREHTSDMLDELIGNALVLDLRAGAYKSFYKPKGEVIECVFLKDGKTVNHWSKAYRGVLLRAVAEQRPETVETFTKLKIEGLALDAWKDGVARYVIN